MKRCLPLLACILLACPAPTRAQTRLKLSTVVPGSENVQLVYNGDFQFQGSASAGAYPSPVGWSRQADMFAGPGTNMVPADSGVVAFASAEGGASVCQYRRTVSLLPNTDYVLSAYIWNFGDSGNHVTAVIDLNDAPNEPQITLSYSDANADQGYFVYRSFNTADTGSNVTLRLFYDGFTGSGTAPAYFPVAAQWDNLAITKAADFTSPLPSGSGANLRPLVRIDSPSDSQSMVVENVPATLPISTSVSDLDGSITKVEFFANSTRLGQVTADPYSFLWANPPCGSYQLTAVATDNDGATTVSAPVDISTWVVPQPVRLRIAPAGADWLLAWPTTATPASLQATFNLSAVSGWQTVTNTPVVSGSEDTVTLPNTNAQRFFRLGSEVDPSTMDHKLLMGYQGWFACPQDGSALNRWVHWFRSQTPVAANATVDFWPDVSELDPDELFDTGMTLPDGSPARVYSAYNRKTVLRHFKWMKDYHLDGVFLQRFSSSLSDPASFAFRNRVAANVRVGADTYGRVFAIMYDISGQNASTLVSTLTNDWAYLTTTMGLTNSPRYLHHHGKPVIAIWGFGFTDRPGTPADAEAVIAYFKASGCTVMGGVPTHWRTLSGDSQTDPAWATAYRSFDIISPWAVGRYGTLAQADSFKQNQIIPDLADAKVHHLDYMPVIFPGFSWYNLNDGPLNQIPRLGGAFYWRQALNAISGGCTMIYGAMFDEMDEGTAMLKMAATPAQLPAQGSFVPLNIDGQNLPSDWYLRVADQASRMLRGDIPLQGTLPITP